MQYENETEGERLIEKERQGERKGVSDQINLNILCQIQEETGFFCAIFFLFYVFECNVFIFS